MAGIYIYKAYGEEKFKEVEKIISLENQKKQEKANILAIFYMTFFGN